MEIRRRPPNPKVRVSHLEYAVPHDDEEPRNMLEKIVWAKDREIDAARDGCRCRTSSVRSRICLRHRTFWQLCERLRCSLPSSQK